MPRFKKETFHVRNKAGAYLALDVVININAEGEFYANLPAAYRAAFADKNSYLSGRASKAPEDMFRVVATTYELLKTDIEQGLRKHLSPEVTETPVIRYNIESHVTFATDDKGDVYPNAGFPGARWPDDGGLNMFGSHHAANPSPGGYSLTMSAKAMLKRTIRYGDNVRVEYENFYDGGHHLGRDNPAQLLNSWAAMDLGRTPKELPYSPKTALFFHNLLLGMARLNQQIQAVTFDQENLLKLIDKQEGVPMLQGPRAAQPRAWAPPHGHRPE
jgi:hypothetical protein